MTIRLAHSPGRISHAYSHHFFESSGAPVTAAGTDATEAPTILFYARDPANICTLVGLSSGVAALYLLGQGEPYWAAVALLWAVTCDLVDGQIARRTPGRTPAHQEIGTQLDSLVDVVVSGVLPGALLLTLGDQEIQYLPGAVLLPCAAVLRLSYFNVHSAGADRFRGVPVYYNPIVVAAAMLLSQWSGHQASAVHLAVILVVLLNLSSLDVPKQRGTLLRLLFVVIAALSVALVISDRAGAPF